MYDAEDLLGDVTGARGNTLEVGGKTIYFIVDGERVSMSSEQTDCEIYRRTDGLESLKGRAITSAGETEHGYRIRTSTAGEGKPQEYAITPGCEDGEILCSRVFEDINDFMKSKGFA